VALDPRSDVLLTHRFVDALAFAMEAHGDQTRKGGDIPYVSHLLGVASLVLEAGGDEDMAIAGLLHDTIEDTATTFADIDDRYGPRVAGIVYGCSDTDEMPKPPWRARKERYIAHLMQPSTHSDVLAVSLADKLHNARSMLADYRSFGEEVSRRFNSGPSDQLWYYQTLAGIFQARIPGPMTTELRHTVDQLGNELRQFEPRRPLP
jgi:(p)ppGpp synthase/HD superfamily hydrolase